MGGGGLVAKQLAFHQAIEMVKLRQVALAELVFFFNPWNACCNQYNLIKLAIAQTFNGHGFSILEQVYWRIGFPHLS